MNALDSVYSFTELGANFVGLWRFPRFLLKRLRPALLFYTGVESVGLVNTGLTEFLIE